MRRPSGSRAMLLVLALLSACTSGNRPPIERPAPPVIGGPIVYVAIGASETAGVGTRNPLTQAWPKVLWQEALPEAALYNLGRAGSTLLQASKEQVGAAVALQPDVVTVWLNVNDLIAGVPADRYGRQLRSLLSRLVSSGHATVLIANTPQIDSLPIYRACRPNPPAASPTCPLHADIKLPPPTKVRAAVDAYNAKITQAARATGAVVVDLHAFGEAPRTHPEWIAKDGFHPSTAGAEAIAKAFASALPPEIVKAASVPR